MVDTDQKLRSALPKLRSADWIAVDTEADSLHAYPEKLCLLQISIEDVDLLLDPLAGMDMKPVLETLSQHELILHGADYDLRLLRKSFGFVPGSIFDTMLASRLLGQREFGLTHLVEKYLGVKLEKGPQKANWARRPLTERMEAYARNDTHYLRPLAELLRAELKISGRLGWHQETCARLVAECAVPRTADPDAVWRVKGSHRLRPGGLGVLRELWSWREKEAVSANKPPYFILPPEIMVAISDAATEGKSFTDLLPRSFSARRQHALREAVEEGLKSEKLPGHLRPKGHRQTETEKRRLRDYEERRDQRAKELGIDPTLIANRATLILLAKDWSEYEAELMNWQRTLLAPTVSG